MNERGKVLKQTLSAVFLLLLLAAILFAAIGYYRGHFVSAEKLEDYIASCGPFAPLLLTAIQTMQAFLPIIPSFLGFAAGAGLFGTLGGFLCNYIGICLGSVIAYFLARRFGSGFVRQIIPEKKFQKAVDWAQSGSNYPVVLFLAILLPLAPDCALCYLSGLIRMPIKKYLLILLTAKPWCILLYSILFGELL